jgi:hypothetical protein
MQELVKFSGLLNQLYRGEYSENQRDGFGIQLFTSGFCYSGEWSQNRAHGLGKLFYPNGSIAQGVFIQNRLTQGSMTFFDGSFYEGSFSQSETLWFTEGKLSMSNGVTMEGLWEENSFIEGMISYSKSENGKKIEMPLSLHPSQKSKNKISCSNSQDLIRNDILGFESNKELLLELEKIGEDQGIWINSKKTVFVIDGLRGLIIDNDLEYIYTGPVKKGRKDGFGLIFSGKTIIAGNFSNNLITGFYLDSNFSAGIIKYYKVSTNAIPILFRSYLFSGTNMSIDKLGKIEETTYPFIMNDCYRENLASSFVAEDWQKKLKLNKGFYVYFTAEGSIDAIQKDEFSSPQVDAWIRTNRILFTNIFKSIMKHNINFAPKLKSFLNKFFKEKALLINQLFNAEFGSCNEDVNLLINQNKADVPTNQEQGLAIGSQITRPQTNLAKINGIINPNHNERSLTKEANEVSQGSYSFAEESIKFNTPKRILPNLTNVINIHQANCEEILKNLAINTYENILPNFRSKSENTNIPKNYPDFSSEQRVSLPRSTSKEDETGKFNCNGLRLFSNSEIRTSNVESVFRGHPKEQKNNSARLNQLNSPISLSVNQTEDVSKIYEVLDTPLTQLKPVPHNSSANLLNFDSRDQLMVSESIMNSERVPNSGKQGAHEQSLKTPEIQKEPPLNHNNTNNFETDISAQIVKFLKGNENESSKIPLINDKPSQSIICMTQKIFSNDKRTENSEEDISLKSKFIPMSTRNNLENKADVSKVVDIHTKTLDRLQNYISKNLTNPQIDTLKLSDNLQKVSQDPLCDVGTSTLENLSKENNANNMNKTTQQQSSIVKIPIESTKDKNEIPSTINSKICEIIQKSASKVAFADLIEHPGHNDKPPIDFSSHQSTIGIEVPTQKTSKTLINEFFEKIYHNPSRSKFRMRRENGVQTDEVVPEEPIKVTTLKALIHQSTSTEYEFLNSNVSTVDSNDNSAKVEKVFKGTKIKGLMQGCCLIQYEDDSVFHGYFVDGMKNGAGITKNSSNSVLMGRYRNDVPVGLFLLIHEGKTKKGNIVDGKFVAREIRKFDACEIECDINEIDQFEGKGLIRCSNFEITCDFKADKIISEEKCRLREKNFDIELEGFLKLNKRNEEGFFETTSKELYKISLKKGKIKALDFSLQ